MGWRVRDLHGKYSFSNDVIFNESLSGRLGVPRPLSSSTTSPLLPPSSPHVVRDRPRVRSTMGQAYDEVLRLKEFRRLAREQKRLLLAGDKSGGGSTIPSGRDGGVPALAALTLADTDGSLPSLAVIDAFHSLIASSSIPDSCNTFSLPLMEFDILSLALRASAPFHHRPSRPFDLSKIPASYSEAIARPDAPVWRAAMDRERQSLLDMGAFEEADLPPGQKAIGLKWVYDFKTDALGVQIHGKEKARLVAQGFTQRPDQYGETYAPVAKMASVRILLTWAAINDLEIFQFDCKTVFSTLNFVMTSMLVLSRVLKLLVPPRFFGS